MPREPWHRPHYAVGNQALESPDQMVAPGMQGRVALNQQLNPRQRQDAAEDVDREVEPLQKKPSGQDESRAHDQSAQHTPEEHPMLKLRGDGESLEDHDKDEEIVGRQGLLQQIPGGELQPAIEAVGVVDPGDKEGSHHNPKC